MGGSGSGRWEGYTRKQRVEECLALDLNLLMRGGLFERTMGRIHWPEKNTSMDYQLKPTDHPHVKYLYLCYRVRVAGQAENVCQPVTLQAKPQRLGGVRWWIFCPCWCKRYVSRIYLPSLKAECHSRSSFGCRACHDLTYRSVQEHSKRRDLFRQNPHLLSAALVAGSYSALRLVLREGSTFDPSNIGTILP
jgi:hypothetical protein